MIFFQVSRLNEFNKEWSEKKNSEWKYLRYGQALHGFFRLSAVVRPEDKNVCDVIYYEGDESVVRTIVAARIDPN